MLRKTKTEAISFYLQERIDVWLVALQLVKLQSCYLITSYIQEAWTIKSRWTYQTSRETNIILITVSQHGFGKDQSCPFNLLVVLDDWTQAFDTAIPGYARYMDISKSFVWVNHSVLLQNWNITVSRVNP